MAENRRAAILHGLIVWLVIAAAGGYCIYRQAGRAGDGEKSADRIGLQAQARYLIGLKSMGMPTGQLLDAAKGAFAGDPARLAILAGELEGPDEALALLPEQEETAALLRHLYGGKELEEDECETIRERFGWFGKLALSQQDEALHAEVIAESRRTVFVLIALALGLILGVLLGLFLLILLGILALHGHLKPATGEGHSLVYAEMFALYMVSFLGLGYLASFIRVPGWSLALSGLAALLTLAALGWPLLRGVGWQRVRGDLGLYTRRPLIDIALGFGTYAAALPMLLVGAVVMLLLTALLKRAGFSLPAPSHPLGGIAEGATPWWVWVQVFVVACVIAPIVEEIFFRGALFTHLRRLLPNAHRLVRFLLAAAVSSFLFAVIHPQGILGVPLLGALAGAFCLAREVNGSLLPCIVAHAINNLVATLLLLLAIA